MKCYEIHDGYDGWSIVFADTNVAARRIGANQIDAGFSNVTCRRRPEWDQYAPGPVPPLARIAGGWWYECACCGRRVSENLEADIENDGLDPADFNPVEDGRLVYCSSTCSQIEWANRRANKAAEVALIEVFEANFVGAQILQVNVYGNRVETKDRHGAALASVTFRLPGCTGNVHWVFGDETCSMSLNDVEPYYAWRGKPVPEEMKKRVSELRQRYKLPEAA